MPRQKQKNYGQLVRINLNVSEDMKKWYQEEAERRGLYMTSLIINAMHDYMKQEEAMNKMQELGSVKELLEQFKGLTMPKVGDKSETGSNDENETK